MSKRNREKREAKIKIILRRNGHPNVEYSEETKARLLALKGETGVMNQVAIFHEQFCADALRRGAKKCMCRPDIKIVTEKSTELREVRAWKTITGSD